MTAKEGFVWILPVYVSLKLNETSLFQSNQSCKVEQLQEVLNGHFALAHANVGNDSDIIPSNITVAEWKSKYIKRRSLKVISPSDYAPFVYDSIWVYAKALEQLIIAGNTIKMTLNAFQ